MSLELRLSLPTENKNWLKEKFEIICPEMIVEYTLTLIWVLTRLTGVYNRTPLTPAVGLMTEVTCAETHLYGIRARSSSLLEASISGVLWYLSDK